VQAATDKFARPERPSRDKFERGERPERPAFPKKERVVRPADAGMTTFRIEVGYDHGVKPGNIVGAIANEAGLDAKHIGRIEIFEDHTILDLPDGMPPDILRHLKTVWCAGQQLRITRDGEPPDNAGAKTGSRPPFAGKKSFGEKKPFAGKKDFGDRPFKSGKPKPHRKGPTQD
jgi:ATP-dependent RNA helicase DeaD